jgi:hypothetical protein
MDEIFVETGRIEPEIQTLQDFSDSMGVLRAAENAMAQVIAANYHRQVGLCVRVTVLLATKRHHSRSC